MHYQAEKDAAPGVSPQRPLSALAEMLVLLAVWAAAVVLVNARGNFPVYDDWHHAWSTLQLANTGTFHPSRYAAPSLRAQFAWGALWVRIFGFSFEVLHASTLVLSAASVILINRMLAALALPAVARWIASLAFTFHPMFFLFSFTFMTEVPYVFVSIVAYALFARGLRRDSMTVFVAGTAAALLSCFIRQTGAISIGATGIVLVIFRDRITRRWMTCCAVLACAIAALGLVAWLRLEWLTASTREFRTHYDMWSQSNFGLFEQTSMAYHYIWFQVCYSTLFFLPLTLPLFLLVKRTTPRASVIVVSLIAVALLARSVSLVLSGYTLPFTNTAYHSDIIAGQTLTDFGLGTLSLPAFNDVRRNPVHLLPAAKAMLTIAVAIPGAIALWALLEWTWTVARQRTVPLYAVLAASFAYCGSAGLIASSFYFDRYSFDSAWALVLVLPLLVPWRRPPATALSVVALLVLALFSITATHDYFAWNRARWRLYDTLRARGIPANQIQAGVEVTGWVELVRNPSGPKWPDVWKRPYAIVFRPPAGSRTIATAPYRRWLGAMNDDLYAVAVATK